MNEIQKKQFFSRKQGEPTTVKNFSGKFSLSNFPKDIKQKVLKRLAEKDEVMNKGLRGILPGIKIDGREVTKDNIHEFEIKEFSKKVEEPMTKEEIKNTEENIKETEGQEVEKYSKEYLKTLTFKELKKIGLEFGTTDRSKKNLIKEILNLQGGK